MPMESRAAYLVAAVRAVLSGTQLRELCSGCRIDQLWKCNGRGFVNPGAYLDTWI